MFRVFRVKNHDFMPKNHIFSNFRVCVCRVRPPPAPLDLCLVLRNGFILTYIIVQDVHVVLYLVVSGQLSGFCSIISKFLMIKYWKVIPFNNFKTNKVISIVFLF